MASGEPVGQRWSKAFWLCQIKFLPKIFQMNILHHNWSSTLDVDPETESGLSPGQRKCFLKIILSSWDHGWDTAPGFSRLFFHPQLHGTNLNITCMKKYLLSFFLPDFILSLISFERPLHFIGLIFSGPIKSLYLAHGLIKYEVPKLPWHNYILQLKRLLQLS